MKGLAKQSNQNMHAFEMLQTWLGSEGTESAR